MTERSPSTETIRALIEILSARVTPIAELPQTIANITRALNGLGAVPDGNMAKPATVTATAKAGRRPLPLKPIKAISTKTVTAAARPGRVEPAREAVVTVIPARGRGRPRRIAVAAPVVETPVVDVAPPQPRLLRRADALANDAQHHTAEPQPVFRTPDGTLRGVVKWFDGRAGKGALRLTGISGDVLLDPGILARSGIKRLYKDQEVEATVQDTDGRVRLLSLSLPTRNSEPSLNMMGGEITGTLRRQPRSVQVQVKRDSIRQSAARAEAEQVLGGVGRIKATRRLTP